MLQYAAFVREEIDDVRHCNRGFLAALLAAATIAATLLSPPAAAAADPNKVYRMASIAEESGFDPTRVSDEYSATVFEAIFERLLTYDYLARPAKLVPMVAEAMPEVSDNGRTYTFHLQKGIYFTDDPAFKGVKRELVAQDFVYSIARFFDPKNRSQYAFMLEGIVGVTEASEQAKKTGKFDYDAKIAGLEAVDRYTLRIRLKDSDYSFPFKIAHTSYGAVAREVIEAYPDDTMGHPVGTGPYMLKEWLRGAKIVLVANPGYRGFVWDFAPSEAAWDDALVAAMKGKTMPQIGRVEIAVMEEAQSRWLAFQSKELDTLNLPAEFRERALGANMKPLPELAQRGVTVFQDTDLDIVYTTFNLRDPVVGGFGKEKLALRRALIMAYDIDAEINVVRKGLAVPNDMPVPRGVVGYDPTYKSVNPYDPDLANKLLDRFGYKVGPDGYRAMPDGSPLVLRLAIETSNMSRQLAEVWLRSAERVKIRIQFDVSKFQDHRKAAEACQLMMWGQGWTADYPDGDNFMQLLYGPNTGANNSACYQSKAFDGFYDKARLLPDSAERRHLYLEMSRQMEVDGAWSIGPSRLRNQLIQPWVKGYKYHPILHSVWLYMDVEPRR